VTRRDLGPGIAAPGRPRALIALVNHMRERDQVRGVAILSYRNQSICYARTVAYCARSGMLFSSGKEYSYTYKETGVPTTIYDPVRSGSMQPGP